MSYYRPIYTARRYAGAVYAVVVCPSVGLFVRPSVCHKPSLYQNDYHANNIVYDSLGTLVL